MLSHLSHVQLFASLRTVARLAPLSVGFSREEYWSGLPCPPPGHLPDPGVKLASLCLLHWQAGSLLLVPALIWLHGILVVACELLVVTPGSSSLTRDGTRGPLHPSGGQSLSH